MQRRQLLTAATLMAIAPAPWAQSTATSRTAMPARLRFGLITPRNADVMLRNWNPFFDRMAQGLGVPVERQTYASQGELVRDFAAGQLDLGWMGNAPALELVEAGHGSVFAAMVVQGRTAYRSVLITHRDSPLRGVEDVLRMGRGLTFGDGDLKSTSGHIVPRYFAFVKRGVNEPEKLFREVRRGSHEANLQAAASRQVDVATNNTSELDNFRTSRPDDAAAVRVIWESPDIPESPMVWRNDLPLGVRARIAAFVHGFGRDEDEKAILWNINKVTAWRRSSNRQLVTIADLEMFNARQRIINDGTMTAGERAARVDEVTRRGSKLEMMLKASS